MQQFGVAADFHTLLSTDIHPASRQFGFRCGIASASEIFSQLSASISTSA